MPFTAEAKNGSDTWERVDITQHATPKLDFKGYELRCADPDCHAPMIVKHGFVITPHFAHAANAVQGDCVFAGAPESEQHRLGKMEIARKLAQLTQYRGAEIRPEQILRIGERKRVADIYVLWPDGSSEVHEIQLARTTIRECEERTNDYQGAGVDTVIWWFGGDNRNDSSLRQWAEMETGAVGVLDFISETQRI